jgi:rare lipoprotein A
MSQANDAKALSGGRNNRGAEREGKGKTMVSMHLRHFGLATVTFLVLTGCQPGQGPLAGLGKSPDAGAEGLTDATATAPASTERGASDAEAPEIFAATDDALWDGRPSLGGVWVASPQASDPERVILRNPDNGKSVIGALFRRERDNPGPELQISSDAAAALGLLAGQPAKISVTALRRDAAPAEAAAVPDAAAIPSADATAPDDPLAGAAAAIDRAEGKLAMSAEDIDTVALDAAGTVAAGIPEQGGKPLPRMNADALAPDVQTTADAQASSKKIKPKTAAAKPAAAAAPAASGGARIQIGIFSVEANANRTVDALAKAGITGSVRKGETQGKSFWMVTTKGDKATLAKVKAAGFADAFILKG